MVGIYFTSHRMAVKFLAIRRGYRTDAVSSGRSEGFRLDQAAFDDRVDPSFDPGRVRTSSPDDKFDAG